MTEPERTEYTVPLIQIQAFDTAKLPDAKCPMPERVLWWTLRDVYARYKSGQISKETGETLKLAAMQTYKRDRAKLDLYVRLVQHQTEMWNRIEHAATVYAKSDNRTPEADAFHEAVYGCKLKGVTESDGQ